MVSLEYFSLT